MRRRSTAVVAWLRLHLPRLPDENGEPNRRRTNRRAWPGLARQRRAPTRLPPIAGPDRSLPFSPFPCGKGAGGIGPTSLPVLNLALPAWGPSPYTWPAPAPYAVDGCGAPPSPISLPSASRYVILRTPFE